MNITIEKKITKNIPSVDKESVQNNHPPDAEISTVLQNEILNKKRVEYFQLYRKYLEDKNFFLDWGCENGLSGDRAGKLEIKNCDLIRGKCQKLSQKINLFCSQLNHYPEIPDRDKYCDVVIGNRVDRESFKELDRIIKNQRYLIIRFFPNCLSYTEFLPEKLRNLTQMRKYSIAKIKDVLLHSGFIAIEWRDRIYFPSLTLFLSRLVSDLNNVKKMNNFPAITNKIYNFNKYAEKILSFNILATNIYIIAQIKAATA